ncbi:hypothetical protein B0H12DRAFT_1077789 [Mycena haematopus]|nr:hypothetical protein B0H12DRAFT_1077789 [Mycena haematopus]
MTGQQATKYSLLAFIHQKFKIVILLPYPAIPPTEYAIAISRFAPHSTICSAATHERPAKRSQLQLVRRSVHERGVATFDGFPSQPLPQRRVIISPQSPTSTYDSYSSLSPIPSQLSLSYSMTSTDSSYASACSRISTPTDQTHFLDFANQSICETTLKCTRSSPQLAVASSMAPLVSALHLSRPPRRRVELDQSPASEQGQENVEPSTDARCADHLHIRYALPQPPTPRELLGRTCARLDREPTSQLYGEREAETHPRLTLLWTSQVSVRSCQHLSRIASAAEVEQAVKQRPAQNGREGEVQMREEARSTIELRQQHRLAPLDTHDVVLQTHTVEFGWTLNDIADKFRRLIFPGLFTRRLTMVFLPILPSASPLKVNQRIHAHVVKGYIQGEQPPFSAFLSIMRVSTTETSKKYQVKVAIGGLRSLTLSTFRNSASASGSPSAIANEWIAAPLAELYFPEMVNSFNIALNLPLLPVTPPAPLAVSTGPTPQSALKWLGDIDLTVDDKGEGGSKTCAIVNLTMDKIENDIIELDSG